MQAIIRNAPRIVTFYLAELLDNNKEIKLASEFVESKWVSLQDACDLLKHQDQKDLILTVFEHLKRIKAVEL